MAINFPDSPTLDEEFTASGRTWIWDGTAWVAAPVEIQVEVADITDLTATATELNFVDGVTSSVQTQLDGKAATSHTHVVSNITDLTATTTELNYTDGVTSNIQTQLNNKAAFSHTHTSSQITDLTSNVVSRANGTVATASTSSTVVRNITLSTSDPSGGIDGDVWLKYTA